ncbi:hypothetical protein BD626DRAFT_43256 [Schizophyllum amplum]|uniref:Uncharacterized protein n=1 Tax=Schizophyllum amplum TaxID=97359 RepID=A0A550CDP6_9AGAR|nr:hypothetical protein BD626DRAFT_43256 [Auriculariopsis ampla]
MRSVTLRVVSDVCYAVASAGIHTFGSGDWLPGDWNQPVRPLLKLNALLLSFAVFPSLLGVAVICSLLPVVGRDRACSVSSNLFSLERVRSRVGENSWVPASCTPPVFAIVYAYGTIEIHI